MSSGCIKARITLRDKIAIVETEDGKKALVPLRALCSLAKRFNLCYENYRCEN